MFRWLRRRREVSEQINTEADALIETPQTPTPSSVDERANALTGIVRPIFRVVFGCGSFRP